jgi:hypothetical protein
MWWMADSRQSATCPEGRWTRVRKGVGGGKGQALVEFTLVLPLILLIVLGIIDFGRAFNYQNDMTSMANIAVRYAEVNGVNNGTAPANGCGYPATIQDYTRCQADSNELKNGTNGSFGVSPPGVCVKLTFPDGSQTSGKAVKATVSANYRWLPFLHLAALTISASAVTKLQQNYTLATGASSNGPCP